MNSILVWFLIVMSNDYRNNPYQHGPFSDKASCEKVQEVYLKAEGSSLSPNRRAATCVQVSIPWSTK